MKATTEASDVSAEVLMGQVVEEFLDHLNRGERPEVESYVRRYPQLASVLRQMLPALELMRSVKRRFDPAGVCNPGLFVGGI